MKIFTGLTFAILFIHYSCMYGGASDARKDDTSKYNLIGITTLSPPGGLGENAGHADWSADGTWIAYDAVQADSFTDIFIIHPDGSGNTCLTCDHPDLPNKHQGNSDWHASGRWLLFQAELAKHWMNNRHAPCRPGGGFYNDLFVMDLFSPLPHKVHKLTTVRNLTPPGGSLHSHFNWSGSKIIWGDLEGTGGYFGNWRIACAEFKVFPFPHLENIIYVEPAKLDLWYETHGWGHSDSYIYFTGTDVPGMDENAMDICKMNLVAGHDGVIRLTKSSGLYGEPEEWDEHAQLSPQMNVFSFMSSSPYGVEHNAYYNMWLKTDMWLMNADGSGQKRVTYFNEPGYPEYSGRTICADNSWSPDGFNLLVAMRMVDIKETHIKILHFSIDGLITLPASY